ncbi:hypothetical protein QTO34_012919 [Cnephaeus nilssonii]|uniref:Uncharacterized protein n=1 Tax=Cnephaeus nilssonii TaxID=3371016 RepID=A0AA40LCI6_CNENI|nr:hypothetical protein QTO34_012919 [Eptesicus nilssonii]
MLVGEFIPDFSSFQRSCIPWLLPPPSDFRDLCDPENPGHSPVSRSLTSSRLPSPFVHVRSRCVPVRQRGLHVPADRRPGPAVGAGRRRLTGLPSAEEELRKLREETNAEALRQELDRERQRRMELEQRVQEVLKTR